MRIHFLGTASASVTADRDNTSLLVEAGADLILLDCGGNPAGKMLQLGYDPCDLTVLCLTHLHIDHCYGLPTLLFHMFLQKRTEPLHIFCPAEELELMNRQLLAHGIENDVRTYALVKHSVPPEPGRVIRESEHSGILSGLSNHSRATRAYRIRENRTGRTMVYTGDTSPIDEMVDFANKADILVHESTYLESHQALAAEYGHSTALEAGRIAARADARALALVHFECPPGSTVEAYRTEAAKEFKGTIFVPDDMTTLTI
ncbi:MAG TPA: MBL fold metallo-hydrolase [bacterium]|nr:MBL fold metallo-hydrolase [bacterium]